MVSMPAKKAHELYASFEDWVSSHRHSSVSVVCALDESMRPDGRPSGNLRAYVSRLLDIRSEIDSEIREARDWIQYLRRQER